MRYHGRCILLNIDLRTDLNVHGTEVPITLGVRDSGTRGTRDVVHLVILGRRRLGTGDDEVRSRDIGIDVVRRGGVLAASGDLEAREQASRDGQTRADQTDGGLDVRPQRGLVDGIRGVVGLDPEEDDDAVDTSEADEGAECEDPVQRELVLPGALQVPDHGHGEGQDDEVHEDVEDLVDDEEFV